MPEVSVSIDVPDLLEAVRFYCDALECTKLSDDSETVVVLSAGNVRIYLLQREPGIAKSGSRETLRSYSRHWTPVHLDFAVDDVESATARVLSAGGSVEGTDTGEWRSIAYCADPFGNGFCLIKE